MADISYGMSASELRSAGQVPADAPRLRFEACFRDHYAAVLAFALRRAIDREAAEDAVSETFAVAWRRRDLIPAEPLPWLYGIGRRVLANQRRSSKRRRALGERLDREAEALSEGNEPVESLGERSLFFSAFHRLREEDREVLRLVAWDGLTTEEAAGVLGCSPVAFRVRLHRARRRLAKHLAAAGHPTGERAKEAREPEEEEG